MPSRPHRRAVGPTGASAAVEPPSVPGLADVPEHERPDDRDDERLLADRPPHHDRGV